MIIISIIVFFTTIFLLNEKKKPKGEIDRLLKKVEEGCQAFDQIIQKVYSSSNPNQKEKHEQDLKKEIKKLQRARDQIKTWITSNEVKQKTPLIEARKNIESVKRGNILSRMGFYKMEQFKTCERDSKTKAFSKEGLMQQDRENDQKSEIRNWLMKCLKDLSNQMDQYELEIESIPKKKQANNPRVTELTQFREKHRYYSNQLEKVLKKYENEQLEAEDVNQIKDSIEYYIESHADDDFFEDETVFDNLELDDTALGEISTWESGTQKSQPEDEENEIEETSSKNSTNSGPKTLSMATPIINSFLRGSSDQPPKKGKKEKKEEGTTKKKDEKEEPKKEEPKKEESPSTQEEKKKPIATPNYGLVAKSLASTSPTGFTSPNQKPTQTTSNTSSPVITTHAANNTTQQNSTGVVSNTQLPPQSNTPTAQPTGNLTSKQQESQTVNQPKPESQLVESLESEDEDAFNSETFGGSSTNMGTGTLEELSQFTREKLTTQDEPPKQSMPAAEGSANFANKTERPAAPANNSSQQQAVEASSGASLETTDNDEFAWLQSSMKSLPDRTPTPKPRPYTPKTPVKTPAYYPQAPLAVFDNPEIFSRFDTDTLFFIFYNQQGTYQQYLAAKELKRLSWRYHKKYLTWFKRHEDPKRIYPDYETGTYVYFDYETGWCQRRKTEFTFEYRFLEDFD